MATASIKVVRELGSDGMANRCELLLNVVKRNKPKMLRGLSQKALWAGRETDPSSLADNTATGGGSRAYPILACMRNVVSPSCAQSGKQAARRAHRRAGKGGGSKRTPLCSGADRG
jgi:hypothetical protein